MTHEELTEKKLESAREIAKSLLYMGIALTATAAEQLKESEDLNTSQIAYIKAYVKEAIENISYEIETLID